MASAQFVTGSSYGYDGYGRADTVTDARTGPVTYLHTASGQPRKVTSKNGTVITEYGYDQMGRVTSTVVKEIVGATTTTLSTTSNSYTTSGQVRATWGDQTYASYYEYDEQERMTGLRTYQDLAHGTQPTSATPGSAKTSWIYHSSRGWLVEKNYTGESDNGTADADYTYTAAGRLDSRTWERGVVTDYQYDRGMLARVAYSGETNGHTTPALDYLYDNFGRLKTVRKGGNGSSPTNGRLEASYLYHATNLTLSSEAFLYDTTGTGSNDFIRVLDRKYDTLLRPDGWSLRDTGMNVDHANSYGYDGAGRLAKVHPAYPLPGTANFNYTYLEKSGGLLKKVTSPAHNVSNSYESHRDVLDYKGNNAGSGSTNISAFLYTINNLGQRTNLIVWGSAMSANPPSYDWTYNDRGELVEADDGSTTNNDRAYQYDGIGNREKTAAGLLGNLPGSDNYTADALNQYTSVKINGTAVSPDYDDDGNMELGPLPVQQNANATLLWDAENRLVAVTVGATTTTYRYDYLGRRIGKKVGTATAKQYVYDGWNLIAEYTGTTLGKSYTWGSDLSGSMQGAGGVGGLLSVKEGSATYYPTYDGNGNVSEYLNATGSPVAHYEYDAFGNTTVSTGAKKNDFLHRFSTKPRDAETGLYYYGFRYYDPVTGRWPSRDPIAERGGVSLYGFVYNSPMGWVDILGRDPFGWMHDLVDAIDDGLEDLSDSIFGEGANDEAFALVIPSEEELEEMLENAEELFEGDASKLIPLAADVNPFTRKGRKLIPKKKKKKKKSDDDDKCDKPKKCLPCTPVKGTKMFRTDVVILPYVRGRGSRPHKPFKGTHTHHILVTQSGPNDRKPCFCGKKEISVTDLASPALGEIPEVKVGGGGLAP